LELAADIIIRNEKRMLQEAVTLCSTTARRGRAITGPRPPAEVPVDMIKASRAASASSGWASA
jgi:DNA-directed RNA polymerase beta' subunit